MFCESQSTSNRQSIFERKRYCRTCRALLRAVNHDSKTRYCNTCKQNRAIGHLCHMTSLKNVLPANANNVLYIYFTTLRPRKTKRIPTRQKNTSLNSSACNRFVRDVRKWKTVVSIVNDVAGDGIHFGMIL